MKSLALICVALGALTLPGAVCYAADAAVQVAVSSAAPSAAGKPAQRKPGEGKATASLPTPTSKAGRANARSSTPVNSRVDLAVDVITGSSELPKVLYIVPWRAATAVPGIDTVPNLEDQQLFQSLDPDAHARLLHYRQLLGEHVAEEK